MLDVLDAYFSSNGSSSCQFTSDLLFLGNKFSPEEFDRIKDFLTSLLWFTYRNGFAPIGGCEGPKTDQGWGCMLRCGQMLLAKAYINIHLGKDWRWTNSNLSIDGDSETDRDKGGFSEQMLIYRRILRMFQDKKNAPFSIHQIAQMGVSEGKLLGQWIGPNTIAQVLKKLVVYDDWTRLAIHVAMDNLLISDDVRIMAAHEGISAKDEVETALDESALERSFVDVDCCASSASFVAADGCGGGGGDGNSFSQKHSSSSLLLQQMSTTTNALVDVVESQAKSTWNHPVLIIVPLRLGLTGINSCYISAIREFFRLPQCVGILGGWPNHAVYFYGVGTGEDDRLFFLDPHYCQEHVDLDPIKVVVDQQQQPPDVVDADAFCTLSADELLLSSAKNAEDDVKESGGVDFHCLTCFSNTAEQPGIINSPSSSGLAAVATIKKKQQRSVDDCSGCFEHSHGDNAKFVCDELDHEAAANNCMSSVECPLLVRRKRSRMMDESSAEEVGVEVFPEGAEIGLKQQSSDNNDFFISNTTTNPNSLATSEGCNSSISLLIAEEAAGGEHDGEHDTFNCDDEDIEMGEMVLTIGDDGGEESAQTSPPLLDSVGDEGEARCGDDDEHNSMSPITIVAAADATDLQQQAVPSVVDGDARGCDDEEGFESISASCSDAAGETKSAASFKRHHDEMETSGVERCASSSFSADDILRPSAAMKPHCSPSSFHHELHAATTITSTVIGEKSEDKDNIIHCSANVCRLTSKSEKETGKEEHNKLISDQMEGVTREIEGRSGGCFFPCEDATTTINDSTFHCTEFLSMKFQSLDPSLALGFLCQSEREYEDLVNRLKSTVLSASTPPLFEVLESRPRGWPLFHPYTWNQEPITLKEYDDFGDPDNMIDDEQFEILEL